MHKCSAFAKYSLTLEDVLGGCVKSKITNSPSIKNDGGRLHAWTGIRIYCIYFHIDML